MEARPSNGLAIDFVVEADGAQLSEIVQRVRDGRLRTNIGNVSTLDDAVAALNPTERRQGEYDYPRSSLSDARPLMRAAGRLVQVGPLLSMSPRVNSRPRRAARKRPLWNAPRVGGMNRRVE